MRDVAILNQTIISTEVAPMVDKTHAALLKDIRRYCTQIQQINNGQDNEVKIDLVDFFNESTYKDNKGEERPCYLVTKQGCEFIAHKLTGVKGTAFTARYIQRFHEMEEALKDDNAPKIPKNEKSGITLPPAKHKWYDRNAKRIHLICQKNDWEIQYLYHRILKECGEKYDLDEGKAIHKRNTGKPFEYAIDIVEYFPELQELADNFLDYLEKSFL